MANSHDFSFPYAGREVSVSITVHSNYYGPGLTSNYSFSVIIGNYFAGYIVRNSEGVWMNLDPKPNHKNLPFPLTEKHYKRLGEIIEGNLGEFV